MSVKIKDAIGLGCAVATVAIWVAVACSGGDDEPRLPPVDDTSVSAPVETEVVRDPLQDQFDTAWSGLDDETRASYCWALESMTPRELAEFSAELTGQNTDDWEKVAVMINEKCSGE